jgi:hypothetical protein
MFTAFKQGYQEARLQILWNRIINRLGLLSWPILERRGPPAPVWMNDMLVLRLSDGWWVLSSDAIRKGLDKPSKRG